MEAKTLVWTILKMTYVLLNYLGQNEVVFPIHDDTKTNQTQNNILQPIMHLLQMKQFQLYKLFPSRRPLHPTEILFFRCDKGLEYTNIFLC